MLSVITSSLQQTSVRRMQRTRRKDALDLVASIGPGSGAILLVISPIMDYGIAQQWITEYSWNNVVLFGISISIALAILVNVSQHLCLDIFSAVEFQVRKTKQLLIVILAKKTYSYCLLRGIIHYAGDGPCQDSGNFHSLLVRIT